ncbi:MAG: hypothetical protein HYX63_18120 [Gammaproteobacteria bacterium]|nr:hypothetical protein [Gammaproteobacteria bacterium]
MRSIRQLGLGFLVAVVGMSSGTTAENPQDRLSRLLMPPVITAAPGFMANVLIPPGQLYDPLIMLPVGDAIWLNDDGGEEEDKGSRLLALGATGKITVLADIGKLLPTVGFDIAPPGFGEFEGQIFTLAQAKVAMEGAVANHVIQRVDPTHAYSTSIFCTLPDAGKKKISGFGLDARFGPPGSPFAGKLYAITIYNDTIYQVTPDGQCTSFVVFDGQRYSAPAMIAFAPDGQNMLVSVSRGAFDITSTAAPTGAIVRVSSTGKIDDKPVFEGPGRPMGMDFAPPGFGAFSGQLFFADIGLFQIPVPMSQAIKADGKLYRLTRAGKTELVASGLHNPMGVRFVGDKLWVTDINGDFIAGKRELPDGFVVEVRAR